VVDEVALGRVFSEYFGFLRQFSFHPLLHIHDHPVIDVYIVSIVTASLNNQLKNYPEDESEYEASFVLGPKSKSELLCDWRFTANQFVLASDP
jgi:hypothetical protein